MKLSLLQKGFHLLEIIICLAIVGILAVMTIGNYQCHLSHERRIEAEIALSKLAVAMEQYHASHDTYQGATLAALDFESDIANHAYQFQILAQDQDYVLRAVPSINDSLCGVLQLDEDGKKYVSGNGTIAACW